MENTGLRVARRYFLHIIFFYFFYRLITTFHIFWQCQKNFSFKIFVRNFLIVNSDLHNFSHAEKGLSEIILVD